MFECFSIDFGVSIVKRMQQGRSSGISKKILIFKKCVDENCVRR